MEFNLSEISNIAQRVLETAAARRSDDHATVVTFSGDLGAGKTTLIKEVARQLGVASDLQSPTFVIYKKYSTSRVSWKYLIHGDMYRLEHGEDIVKLGWNDLLTDPENILCIEWPEKITDVIPKYAIQVNLGHKSEETRSVDII